MQVQGTANFKKLCLQYVKPIILAILLEMISVIIYLERMKSHFTEKNGFSHLYLNIFFLEKLIWRFGATGWGLELCGSSEPLVWGSEPLHGIWRPILQIYQLGCHFRGVDCRRALPPSVEKLDLQSGELYAA